MSVAVATRIAECPLEHHSSSSLRLSDEDPQQQQQQGKKCRRRTRRRRSECTETGSIGYGSSAPLESETSYSSHPGYPTCAVAALPATGKVPTTPEMQIQIVQSPPPHLHHQIQQTSSGGSQSSTSTPSSGAYVDVSSSARLAGSMSSARKPRNALVRSRAANTGPTSMSSWNGSAAGEPETSYVVDAEKGNAYYKGALLGKGGFARVYLITEITSRKQFACKIIPKHQMQKIHMQKIAREIMIHKELNHVNVVQMHHYFEDSLNVYMLLEACPKKSLVHVLKYRGKVTEPEARYYMRQMATGVAYIHSQKVIHRDLKPGNMFLSDRMIVKIGDFGLATHPDGQRRRVTICGTPNFIAPEVLFKQAYSYEADVWALGCILYVLLVGQPPFDSPTLKETYSRICNHRYKELDDSMATRAGQDLVRWLLQPNPDVRPSLELVKEHPYLTQEYVPTSLPDNCCYQVPRLPLADRQNPLASFSSSLNFSQPHHHQQAGNLEQQIQQQHSSAAQQTSQKSQDGKKSSGKSSKKKKVSSWLASLRLPKLPRFRQRISSVLCLEARKKQALTCQSEDENLLGSTSIQQMAKALEDCLAGQSRRPSDTGIKVGTGARLEENAAPLFVTKWIDFSNKYGLAFQLSDKSVGVLFNDSTKMSYTHDRRRVEYISSDEEITRYNREKNVPEHLQEKLGLLRHFTDYMDKHLTEGGEVLDHRGQNRQVAARGSTNNVPQMRRWIRTSKAIVMELSVPLLQMNFFDDHTKFIVSQQNGNYLVTYIDGERRASSYWLTELCESGCSPDVHERMLYVYKVAKEFADLDLGAR